MGYRRAQTRRELRGLPPDTTARKRDGNTGRGEERSGITKTNLVVVVWGERKSPTLNNTGEKVKGDDHEASDKHWNPGLGH